MHAVVCPLCGKRNARRRGARRSATDLRGLLRHEAADRNRLSDRLRLPRHARASIRRPPPSGSSSAIVALLVQFMRDFSERQSQLFFADRDVPGPLRAAGAAARSSTRTSRKRRRRWRRRSRPRRAASSTSIGRPRCRPSGWLAALKPVLAEAGTQAAARRSSATRRSCCAASSDARRGRARVGARQSREPSSSCSAG